MCGHGQPPRLLGSGRVRPALGCLPAQSLLAVCQSRRVEPSDATSAVVSSRFASQTAPGRYNEAALRGLDYLLDEARKAGIRVREIAVWLQQSHAATTSQAPADGARCKGLYGPGPAAPCRHPLSWVSGRPRSLPHLPLLPVLLRRSWCWPSPPTGRPPAACRSTSSGAAPPTRCAGMTGAGHAGMQGGGRLGSTHPAWVAGMHWSDAPHSLQAAVCCCAPCPACRCTPRQNQHMCPTPHKRSGELVGNSPN